MYGVLAKNCGMWGCSTWVKQDGEIMKFETKEEAQKVADELNGNRINNFTQYFVEEYKNNT